MKKLKQYYTEQTVKVRHEIRPKKDCDHQDPRARLYVLPSEEATFYRGAVYICADCGLVNPPSFD